MTMEIIFGSLTGALLAICWDLWTKLKASRALAEAQRQSAEKYRLLWNDAVTIASNNSLMSFKSVADLYRQTDASQAKERKMRVTNEKNKTIQEQLEKIYAHRAKKAKS